MTRKHFESLAKHLYVAKPHPGDSGYLQGALDQWQRDVRTVAKVCAEANPAFDRRRFLAACGYEGE